MQRDYHVLILQSYANRLTLSDLSMLRKAKQDCVGAAMNANTDSQIAAQRWLDIATRYIVEHMTEHDLRLIDNTIAQCTGEDTGNVTTPRTGEG